MLELAAPKLFYLLIWASTLALIISGIFTIMNKTGLREWLVVHAINKTMSKAIECSFCFAHHLALVFTAGILWVDFEFSLLLLPLITATIVNKFTT